MSPSRSTMLLRMLDEFEPVDQVETSHVHDLARLLATATSPFSRSHYDPGHVTASAFVIEPRSARILLHHHRKLDRWLQMGGHVDQHEDVAEAALREASEESGLVDLTLYSDRPFDIDVHVIPARKVEPRHLHFDVRFIVTTARPDDATIAPEESIDLAWLGLEEAERRMNAPESTRALRKIKRTLGSSHETPSF